MCASASRWRMSIHSSAFRPWPSRPMVMTLKPFSLNARDIRGPISQDGSNTTRGPRQVQRRVTTLMLLCDPGPANTMLCPGPQFTSSKRHLAVAWRPIAPNKTPGPCEPPANLLRCGPCRVPVVIGDACLQGLQAAARPPGTNLRPLRSCSSLRSSAAHGRGADNPRCQQPLVDTEWLIGIEQI